MLLRRCITDVTAHLNHMMEVYTKENYNLAKALAVVGTVFRLCKFSYISLPISVVLKAYKLLSSPKTSFSFYWISVAHQVIKLSNNLIFWCITDTSQVFSSATPSYLAHTPPSFSSEQVEQSGKSFVYCLEVVCSEYSTGTFFLDYVTSLTQFFFFSPVL